MKAGNLGKLFLVFLVLAAGGVLFGWVRGLPTGFKICPVDTKGCDYQVKSFGDRKGYVFALSEGAKVRSIMPGQKSVTSNWGREKTCILCLIMKEGWW